MLIVSGVTTMEIAIALEYLVVRVGILQNEMRRAA